MTRLEEHKWEDKIVAYNGNGEPLTQAAYKEDIDSAIEEADKGDVISQDEKWRKTCEQKSLTFSNQPF